MQPGARTDARKPYASHPFGRRTTPARSLYTRKPHASRTPFLPFPAMQTAPLEDGRLSSPKRAVRLFHAWEISRPWGPIRSIGSPSSFSIAFDVIVTNLIASSNHI